MCTPLAKLAIGLSATMATAFYYLAAAPPASAVDVCGPGNFSSECGGRSGTQQSPATSSRGSRRNSVQDVPVVESPAPVIAEPVQEVPVVESPAVIAEPVQEVPVVESPAVIAEPVQEVPATEPEPTAPTLNFTNIYTTPTTVRRTAIPEPGTVVALLMTGAGIICFGRKRNKQVGQQR